MPESKVQGELFKLLPLIKNYERKSSRDCISSEYMFSSKEDLKTKILLWLVNEKGSIACQALDELVPHQPHYETIFIRPVSLARMLDLRDFKQPKDTKLLPGAARAENQA